MGEFVFGDRCLATVSRPVKYVGMKAEEEKDSSMEQAGGKQQHGR